MHGVAEALYKAQAAGGEQSAGTSPDAAKDEGVIDAEFTEEKGDR